MYYHRFTSISESTTTTTTTTSSPIGISKSNTHVIYYTKQYDEATNGPNTFDLNDEDEHEFMHQTNVEENVIDHGDTQRTLKRFCHLHVMCSLVDVLLIYKIIILVDE